MPYHLARYTANSAKIPYTHFSILNEMTLALIAPLENQGYSLPESLIPDISQGKMFAKWLRDKKGVNTDAMPTYPHEYADGRVVQAKMYSVELIEEFRLHFNEVWLPQRATEYFTERDSKALPYLPKLLGRSVSKVVGDQTAKKCFRRGSLRRHLLAKPNKIQTEALPATNIAGIRREGAPVRPDLAD